MRFANAVALVGLLLAVLLSGCASKSESKGPPTVPVKGKVVFTRGGDAKSLAARQARIELESIDQPGVRAIGPIEEDGSFVVATVTAEGSGVGAVPGKHRVRIDLDENASKLVAPQFLDFGKSGITITLPSDQPLEIKLWR